MLSVMSIFQPERTTESSWPLMGLSTVDALFELTMPQERNRLRSRVQRSFHEEMSLRQHKVLPHAKLSRSTVETKAWRKLISTRRRRALVFSASRLFAARRQEHEASKNIARNPRVQRQHLKARDSPRHLDENKELTRWFNSKPSCLCKKKQNSSHLSPHGI